MKPNMLHVYGIEMYPILGGTLRVHFGTPNWSIWSTCGSNITPLGSHNEHDETQYPLD